MKTIYPLLAALALTTIACGNPRDPSIVYKKLTPEEFAALPPEDQELPEVQEMMGADWRDPNDPRYATNPKTKVRKASRR